MSRIFKICIPVFLIGIFNGLYLVESLSTENLRHKPVTDKLTLAEWPSYNIQNPYGPGTYAYGYEINDPVSQNIQYRDEEKLANGTVQGSYGIVRTDGMVTLTRYVSDEGGYRAQTQTFNQRDVHASILTTESPQNSSMPTGIGYLDLNPENTSNDVVSQNLESDIIPEDIGQQIINEQEKFNLNLNKTNLPNIMTVTVPQLLDRINDIDDNDDQDDSDNDHEDPDPIKNELTNINLQTLQAILSSQNPITITTTKDDKNHTVGIQFVNNYIPHNFQLIPFFIPKRNKQTNPNDTPLDDNFHDPIDNDNKPFVNDKFHDPLDDFRNENVQKQKEFGKRKIFIQQNRMKLPTSMRRQSNKSKKLKNYSNERRNILQNNRYRILY